MLPKLFEVSLIFLYKYWVLNDYQVFLVRSDCLTRPVKTASDEYLTVKYAVFVVHVGNFVVISGAGHAKHPQTPYVCPVKFAALVIRDHPNFHTFLEDKS